MALPTDSAAECVVVEVVKGVAWLAGDRNEAGFLVNRSAGEFRMYKESRVALGQMSQQAKHPAPCVDLRIPWTLFWSVLAFTALATWFVASYSIRGERTAFQREADVLTLQVQYRLETYVALLRSGVSFFAASEAVSSEEFRRFVQRLRMQEVYPGIQGLGYSALIRENEREAALRELRWLNPQFDFHPDLTPGQELHAIVYLEPQDIRNRRALGFNMHSEPSRRHAMDGARDSGQPRATKSVRLLQELEEDRGQPGFLIYVPVYSDQENIPPTVEARREQLRGFIYGAFRVHDFLDAALRNFHFPHLQVEVFDGISSNADQAIYVAPARDSRQLTLTTLSTIGVAGRPWTIKIRGTPRLGLARPRIIVPIVAVTGLTLAGILFWTTRGMAKSKAAAQRSAYEAARNQQLFERIAGATPDVLFVHDLIEHRNLFVNREITETLGYSPAQLLEMGESWVQIIHEDDRSDILRYMVEVANLPDGEVATLETRALHADGSYRWMLIRTLVFSRDQQGRASEALGIATDITERRITEEALRSANQAKDEFLATLSHELRTPLTPVLAIISTLQHDDRLADDVREELAMARRNVELEARLIDDLLDLTRIVRGKLSLNLEVVDMKEVTEHTAASVVELADRKIDFAVEWTAAKRWVRGDRSRLTQLLWNVLKNAAKFTPPGNQVRLRAWNERTEFDEERLAIEIRDTGIGIDPENLPRIFNAFEQGSLRITRAFGGLGLGLAISKAIAEVHHGEIVAYSDGVGQGSRFVVRIPAVSAPADLPGSSELISDSPAGAGQGLRMLLVEDHHDTAEILTKRLRRGGYRVSHAATVADAIRLVEQAAESPDPFMFVLSDLGLPDGTGYDLMRMLKDRYGLSGFALSGFGMEADIKRSEEAGFLRHFTKPVDLDVLKKALSEILTLA